MKLEYKILWIDNDDYIYDDHQNTIEDYLNNLGFVPVITKGKNYADFEQLHSSLKEFDLFILDYKLDDRKNGNTIIQEIRDVNNIYTDVVFYSTVKDDLRTRIFEDKLNGVYYTGRGYDEFKEDVIKIIDVTIKKVQDVNNLRGLIMAEVAELDRLKKAIVKKYVKKNENHDTLKKYIKEDVFKQLKDQIDEFSYLVDNEADLSKMDISTLVDNFIYDSFKKSRTVFKLKRLDKNCKEIPFVHDDYYKDIIKKRNVFAHEEEVVKDGMVSLTYEDGTPLEFTQEHCIQIRKDIKKYKSILEQISAKLDN